MGISTHYYTVYGFKTKWDDAVSEFNESVYDDAYDDDDTPNVILECISGEYAIFGEILFDSGDLRWGEIEDAYVEIDLDILDEIEAKYRKDFAAKFPQHTHLINDKPFKLMTFVHYS